MNKNCAVILGGYVNGYSIIQELHEQGVEHIALLHYGNQVASYSKKLTLILKISKKKEDLLLNLKKINEKFEKLVIFPTDDHQLEQLHELHDQLQSFCFLPFNKTNLNAALDKFVQYEFCEQLGVPYPKTISINTQSDASQLDRLPFPILIKPNKREDLNSNVFRSLLVHSDSELDKAKMKLKKYMEQGFTFLASECIPGHTNGTIYAYTAYRSPNSKKIENEWVGRKLTQYPSDYGVFSSASNEAPAIIMEQGRKLVKGMDLYGICEPEFKWDPRDGKYKLMEINLRSMMWHRTGNLAGVYLQYTQWCDAIKIPINKQAQQKIMVKFSYLKHEMINLLVRKRYYKYFKGNLRGATLALWDRKDPLPFVIDQFYTIIEFVKVFIKKIIRR